MDKWVQWYAWTTFQESDDNGLTMGISMRSRKLQLFLEQKRHGLFLVTESTRQLGIFLVGRRRPPAFGMAHHKVYVIVTVAQVSRPLSLVVLACANHHHIIVKDGLLLVFVVRLGVWKKRRKEGHIARGRYHRDMGW
jgi:hypothetical protein